LLAADKSIKEEKNLRLNKVLNLDTLSSKLVLESLTKAKTGTNCLNEYL